ncbi:hypothetical protein LTR37_007625 [Vermiconidia calcicola]|uniref:Uncharacterized protein n=1 Tax=Vermiconidia calcicola TaxID=1690605 RepID=A0ACC3NCQ1_9PEZI|nr:hypothetical protein LTR37_007625 [Vermiconidia calcicola]
MAPAATGQKTYVFVDEYNRHKRLKVMRACDGCRKRKIRCDGALQNGPWPCGACTRLKLKCVPPTLDQDEDLQSPDGVTGPGQFSFQATTFSSSRHPNGVLSHQQTGQDWGVVPHNTTNSKAAPVRQDGAAGVYTAQMFGQQLGPRLDRGYAEDDYLASATAPVQYQSGERTTPSLLRTQAEASTESSGDPQEVDAAVKDLSEQMGDLAIDLSSAAPYIANEKKNLAETPAIEEIEVVLPPSVSTDLTVRIPPEMMPSEERALDYFGYFFDYVHPYVPVLNRQAFYERWTSARHSISPLILEGIFACVARYLEDPIEVRRWLALAARHEESFRDVPRVTTIQALIILTKAREFVPKRGYYYRSWMAVKYMTTMAFDLGFQEHLNKHRSGTSCGLSKADCMVRTRMWQTLFCLEVWIGAPQGRTDFAVEHETVEFSLPNPSPEVDAFEHQTSRRTTYLAQEVQNIKQTNMLWQTMRRYKHDWALDPLFTRQNDVFPTWLKNLPPDLQIHYTDDDSPPYIGSDHFVANLHIYHHLILIMHHRPQLQKLLENRDSSFKAHLDVCNEAASLMCRLHEALYRDFGLHGLSFMQRGATITSPDPATNSRARKYFTRHMRILELCESSASPEIQIQINALREAFSQDTSKPFELKQGLGMRSPSTEGHPTPPGAYTNHQSASTQGSTAWPHLQEASSSKTMSPASEYGPPFDGSANRPPMPYHTSSFAGSTPQAYAPANVQQMPPVQQNSYALEPVISNEQTTPVWDPSGIFQQWNTAFGVQAQAAPQPQPAIPDPRMQPISAPVMPQQHMYASQHHVPGVASVAPVPVPDVPTVTPVMWQHAFTSAYVSGQGHKRHRDEGLDYEQYAKRRG